jgi:hypothetical protein
VSLIGVGTDPLECLDTVVESGGEGMFGGKAVGRADKNSGGVLDNVAAEILELR